MRNVVTRKRIFNVLLNGFNYMMVRLDGKKENTHYYEVHNTHSCAYNLFFSLSSLLSLFRFLFFPFRKGTRFALIKQVPLGAHTCRRVYSRASPFFFLFSRQQQQKMITEEDEEVWQKSLSSTSTQIKIDVIYFSLNEFTLIFRITHAISLCAAFCKLL